MMFLKVSEALRAAILCHTEVGGRQSVNGGTGAIGHYNIEQDLSRGDGKPRCLLAALLQCWRALLRRRSHRQGKRAEGQPEAAKGAARYVSKPATGYQHVEPPERPKYCTLYSTRDFRRSYAVNPRFASGAVFGAWAAIGQRRPRQGLVWLPPASFFEGDAGRSKP